MEQQSTSQSEHLLFLFSSDLFTYQLDFSLFRRLNLLPAFSNWPDYLVFKFLVVFLCFFGCYEYWLPCISCVMCHTRHKKQLQEQFLRSHAFLINYHKTLTIKLLAVRLEKVARRKKRKKLESNCKAFYVKRKRNKWISLLSECYSAFSNVIAILQHEL